MRRRVVPGTVLIERVLRGDHRFAGAIRRVSAVGRVTGLRATPADGEITLEWDAATSSAAPITSYVIERGIVGAALIALPGLAGSTLSFTDTGLSNGVVHVYRIAAVDADGTQGPFSAAITVVPGLGGFSAGFSSGFRRAA